MLLSVPSPGPRPTATLPGETSMQVQWAAVTSELLSGGSPITDYILERRGCSLILSSARVG